MHNLTPISFSLPELDVHSLGWDFKIAPKKMDQLQTKYQLKKLVLSAEKPHTDLI